MRLLDPLKRKSAEAVEEADLQYFGMENALEALNEHEGAIINQWDSIKDDILGKSFILSEELLNSITTESELEMTKSIISRQMKEAKLDKQVSRLALEYIESEDITREEDLSNYLENLYSLDRRLERLPVQIRDDISDELGLERTELFSMDKEAYEDKKDWYDFSENVEALPVIEGAQESRKVIQDEIDSVLDEIIDEHKQHKGEINEEHDRVDIPDEPVDWEEQIDINHINEYLDSTGIYSAGDGDVLHLLMEEYNKENGENIESEYPLHFQNTGRAHETGKDNRIDNTVRLDAIDDYFVYEFKHMPRQQERHLKENGSIRHDDDFIDSVKQLNGYLTDLDMPVGVLVYVSSKMEVKEYVVEQHDVDNWTKYQEEFDSSYISNKETYNFNNILNNF